MDISVQYSRIAAKTQKVKEPVFHWFELCIIHNLDKCVQYSRISAKTQKVNKPVINPGVAMLRNTCVSHFTTLVLRCFTTLVLPCCTNFVLPCCTNFVLPYCRTLVWSQQICSIHFEATMHILCMLIISNFWSSVFVNLLFNNILAEDLI